MKAEMYKHLGEKDYDVFEYYHKNSVFARIAKHDWFGYVTLGIISLNAIWIGVCTDRNPEPVLSKAELVFQVGEHFFCVFFTIEITVRFLAFESKINCLNDFWFKFDAVLVKLMILETWFLPLLVDSGLVDSGGSGMSDASMFRIVKLLRLSRMARLMKAMPELVILLKGMAVAARSVFSTLVLLILFLYIFAIIFKEQAEGNEALHEYFHNIAESMWTLLIYGTFMDEISSLGAIIKAESAFLTALLLVFVLVTAFTVLNMLIGVLCEVVTAVAANGKEEIVVKFVKRQLLDVLVRMDYNKNGTISENEFANFVNHSDSQVAFSELGVDRENLLALKDVLFARDDFQISCHTLPNGLHQAEQSPKKTGQFPEKQASRGTLSQSQDVEAKQLTFGEIITLILTLRSSNTAMVRDVVELQKSIRKNQERNAQGQEDIMAVLSTLSADMKQIKQKQERLEKHIFPPSELDCSGEVFQVNGQQLRHMMAHIHGADVGAASCLEWSV
eukprot:gnl/MRDRNA2_/MRDRNA2_132035_c0_seq1.p1 gnl/MRDRNA2_/MRDRNA2_132035_c0~~gnl/MRDRNA2_/MRDRNA2_132035_c0_seq1.p1  ORF type:complete len:515 (-),score=103.07 gnl/MRDRNA2_/MRDRNA2_132035_c0_seq1:271-1779(-)